MDLKFLISLLPVIFMFHDFEEIIFFKPWLSKNKELLKQRFPVLSKNILPHLENLSTSAFALAVAEEFVILSIITYASIYWDSYYIWWAAFMGFSIHLAGHIIQWIVFRKYIPTIITSIISLPLCIYIFIKFLQANIMTPNELIVWALIGLAVLIINLLVVHKLASVFDRWIIAKFGKIL